MSDATPSEQKAATTSLGDLLGEVTRDLSALMRQEVALAKAELKETATTSAKGAGMLGGAGYAASMVVLFLSLALWAALANLVGWGWSGVIVAVLWGIIAAVLYTVGRKELKNVKGAPQTVETLQEIPETFKRNEENR
ncbi:phage holin family protein [Microbacterium oleivorans]|uniref:Phage holin family protein n=1 Tax=Microbacterium oleivorans TaxID=273677 RepID=A0A4R5YMY3_9MICO|nr:phage holin family protein [Microbacterium oleivorans]TDL45982.1 phage holin family protein [Microbacterium oleivorans]